MSAWQLRSSRAALLAAGVALSAAVVSAQDTAPPAPVQIVTLTYQTVTNRQDLKLKIDGKDYVRPVGDMHFALPPGEFTLGGLDPSLRTFCAEPLMPTYAGFTYPFAVEALNRPQSYGLPDTEEGRKLADKKTTFIRELYGRYYQDTLDQPQVAAPAFQTAVWEVFQERDIPDGPMPLNLFTGTFQANYPNEAAAPEFVQLAQKYVQSLTGDDSFFVQNPGLAGLEPIRLSGVPTAFAPAAQSQLALRTAPIAAAAPGGGAPLGGTLGGLGGPLGGIGSGVGGFGGAPFSGLGAGVPFFGAPFAGGSSTVTSPGTTSPISTGTTPGGTGTETGPGGGGPSTGTSPPGVTPPVFTPPPTEFPPTTGPGGGGPPPVPAPPAVVLGLIGAVVALGARWLRASRPPAAAG